MRKQQNTPQSGFHWPQFQRTLAAADTPVELALITSTTFDTHYKQERQRTYKGTFRHVHENTRVRACLHECVRMCVGARGRGHMLARV